MKFAPEILIVGPGFGECIALRTREDRWIIVDSCVDSRGEPAALTYLESIDVDPETNVELIVITHWHDDHIRGASKLVQRCRTARVCIPSVLTDRDFLALVAVRGSVNPSNIRSGFTEIFRVFECLSGQNRHPMYAIANRCLYRSSGCEIFALSPRDREFQVFLNDITTMLPTPGTRNRISFSSKPNRISVALLVRMDCREILLGADLGRSQWLDILDDANTHSSDATVFKVPHHGSDNAHVDLVWSEMLAVQPVAVVTPWKLGSGELPTRSDARRICKFTDRAYITSSRPLASRAASKRRHHSCRRAIRDANVSLGSIALSSGMIRLKAREDSDSDWYIEEIPPAGRLDQYW